MTKRAIIIFFLLTSLVLPMKLFAKIGVAVGTGKIQMDGKLKPGAVHVLPSINVTNKGDEGSEFEVLVQYHSNIPERSPEREWFSFSPESFWLDAEKAQLVEVKLELPIKTEPGDYFCYLEARPIDKSVEASGARIGVAAATKLNFSVAPANIFQGILYKLSSYWKHYAPWSYILALVVVLSVLVLLARKFFAFDFGIQFKKKKSAKAQKEETNEPSKNKKTENSLDLLALALADVEQYTNSLPQQQQEMLFEEARYFQDGVVSFLRRGEQHVLPHLSNELRQVLILSRNGLEKIRRQNKNAYEDSLEIVIRGLLGG